jgi:hypothetical protein
MVRTRALVYRRVVMRGAEWMGTLDGNEAEGGRCPVCARRAELRTCSECGFSAWAIDCPHGRPRRFRFSRGRGDGRDGGRVFCEDCARVPPPMLR